MNLSEWGNHLWQSTVVAALAGLLTLILRKQGAHVRHWVWFAGSVKFLVPFSLLISLGTAVRWPSAKPTVAPRSMVVVATEITQPFGISALAPVGPSPVGTMRQFVPTLLFIAWLLGFLTIVALWVRSWWRMRKIIRAASSVIIAPTIQAMASPALLEPSVFGIIRPVLLVPDDIQKRLSEEQLHSVVAHEVCHIRRRDNLLSSIHMTVAAIFWFYPLVWWLGARLLEERERACDEQVVRLGSDPFVYAESILRVCESYLRAPLTCMAGIAGPNLQKRIEAIVKNEAKRKLNLGRKMLLMSAALVLITAPIAVGVAMGRPSRPQVRVPEGQPVAAAPELEVAPVSATVRVLKPYTEPRQATATATTQKEEPLIAGPSEDRRMVILFFDLSALRPEEVQRAKEASKKFIDTNKRSADLVSVVTHLTTFSVLQDFTPDSQKLDDKIDSIDPQDGRANEAGLTASDVARRLSALTTAAKMLRIIPDKKVMIYFRGAVELPGTADESLLRGAINAAQEANLAFYTVTVSAIDPH